MVVESKTQKTKIRECFIGEDSFQVEYKGLRGSIEILTIDGKSDIESFYQDWVIDKLYGEIDLHCFKDMYLNAEYQAEQRGDEMRGN